MKKINKIAGLGLFLIMTALTLQTNAATLNPTKYFGVTGNKVTSNNDGNDFGYSMGNPGPRWRNETMGNIRVCKFKWKQ